MSFDLEPTRVAHGSTRGVVECARLPEPQGTDAPSGSGSPTTLAEQLLAARAQAVEADREFKRLVSEARARGASVNEMARLFGVAVSTVWTWTGGTSHVSSQKSMLALQPIDSARRAGTLGRANQQEEP